MNCCHCSDDTINLDEIQCIISYMHWLCWACRECCTQTWYIETTTLSRIASQFINWNDFVTNSLALAHFAYRSEEGCTVALFEQLNLGHALIYRKLLLYRFWWASCLVQMHSGNRCELWRASWIHLLTVYARPISPAWWRVGGLVAILQSENPQHAHVCEIEGRLDCEGRRLEHAI